MVKLEDTKVKEYDYIINLSHYEPSKKHPRMSIYNRSAQFSSFSALTGYEDAVKEVGRMTNNKIELDDDKKLEINNKLNNIKKDKPVKLTYFIKDNKKSGGKYIERICNIIKINKIDKTIILSNKDKINIENIIKVEVYDTNTEEN